MTSVRVLSATVSSETSSHTRTVTGSWDINPSTAIPDAGSPHIISGTRVSVELPTPPPQASTHAPHQSIQRSETDSFDNFFGISHSRRIGGTHESRHDTSLPPPPYGGEDLPAYSRWDEEAGPKEPPTLAMFLFKYGFLFPVFWVLGSIILCIPLRAPADWEPTKTAEERAELIAHMRQTEKKWAKRCLIALLSLVSLIVVVALAVWSSTRY